MRRGEGCGQGESEGRVGSPALTKGEVSGRSAQAPCSLEEVAGWRGATPRNSWVGVRRGRWTSQGRKLIGLDRHQQLSGPSHLPIAFLTDLCSARNLPFLLCPFQPLPSARLNSQLMSTLLNSELRFQLPPALPSSEFTPAASLFRIWGGCVVNLYHSGFALNPRQGG